MDRSLPLIALALTLLACGSASCGSQGGQGVGPSAASESEGAGSSETAGDPSCPASAAAPSPLPGVSAEQRSLAYWLGRLSASEQDPDAVLLSPAEVRSHNVAVAEAPEGGLSTLRTDLLRTPTEAQIRNELRERLGYIRERMESGEYVDRQGAQIVGDAALRAFDPGSRLTLEPSLRVVLAPLPLRCGPRAEGFYKAPVDLDFDRNNCSTLRPQEPAQVLGRWPNGMLLLRSRYSMGWVPPDAPLSPPLSPDQARAFIEAPRARARGGLSVVAEGASGERAAHLEVEGGLLLPLAPSEDAGAGAGGSAAGRRVLFADASGMHRSVPLGADALRLTERPLTRRALLEEAFARLDRPYGWGGAGGGLDCSRFLMDVFAELGLELPRHSARQAEAGTFSVELEGLEDPEARLRLLDAAERQGAVLLHFPGHIMLYLGRDEGGRPMAIHSFAEYVEPCSESGPGGGEGRGEGEGEAPPRETLRRVNRVDVSDLSLGQGSSRRSFLERLTHLVVLGPRVGPELAGVASLRRAAPPLVVDGQPCEDSLEVRIFQSPARPVAGQPVRVIATSTRELGPARLALIDPQGRRQTLEAHRLGGPPYTYWAQVDQPEAGTWTAVLGDGERLAACDRFGVARFAGRPEPIDPNFIWRPRWRWEGDTEALYAAFVEQLFAFPADDDRTWTNLQTLLRDPAHNLLYNHLGQNEDEELRLEPDCADLPYFLRVYFAWKLRLPFAFRRCTRGRRGRPVACTELVTPQMPHEMHSDASAFSWFLHFQVQRGVHSASGRTQPRDSETDLYPVPMTRDALRPGTVFADPYGHLLIVAGWIPQGRDNYGILIGADAQPDGTIGRRRFWRGSFLFDPDTSHVGAGFKRFRPIVYDRREETYTALTNEELNGADGLTPYSEAQYEGDTDHFYERMEGLINPRPLDPEARQVALVDALEEQVTRRLVSVDNGERYLREGRGVVEMPEGEAIFQTEGAWENYSTPSRDMRLLIAIDAVLGFPESVRRSPGLFGLDGRSAEEIAEAVRRVRARQQRELAARRFSYTNSAGRPVELRLSELVDRQEGLEVAYNPNDCVEIRWGAPSGSEERGTCRRHAPAFQLELMRRYRPWFHERRRPSE